MDGEVVPMTRAKFSCSKICCVNGAKKASAIKVGVSRSRLIAVIIFSNSVRLLKMIAEFIATSCKCPVIPVLNAVSGFAYDLLTGEVDRQERQVMVDDFQNLSKDHYILLVSTLAGGVGLNLTAVSRLSIKADAGQQSRDLRSFVE